MTTLDILRKARALIAKGWTRGTYSKEKGSVVCYCALGAIRQVGERFVVAEKASGY